MKRFKTAVIGCGTISLAHLFPLDYTDKVELVAVCDIKEDIAKATAERFKCKYYTDYKQMLQKEEIEVVHLCTPHYLHSEMAQYLCNLGKHVFTEKPMSINYEDSLKMLKAAEDNNVKLGVVFQNRYNASSQLVKQSLISGRLGKIKSAKASVTWCRTDDYYLSSDWKGTWEKEGGGVVIDQAIHTLDLMRWFIDDEIEYVDARISNRHHKIIQVEDCAEGIIKYKNGVITSFYAMNYYSYDAPIEIAIHCENGIAKITGDYASIIYNDGQESIAKTDITEKEKYGPFNKDCWGISHIKQINNFYESIEKNNEAYISVYDTLKTQRMICAIYESGKTQSKIFL
ncbi:Gfo/Idh/MocA family oxidoreductase [Clostridium sp. YIM B02505]|uniref:Gfo/Idh/MocA family oxidoreductase n=2 Tax=Clostridium yunnanense TaxID=2800325 RepID=A0ABS1EPJ7_9CLOT|nr:Gfo/Idh/MocA family oxidoreductase [Clostridium yunnanense]